MTINNATEFLDKWKEMRSPVSLELHLKFEEKDFDTFQSFEQVVRHKLGNNVYTGTKSLCLYFDYPKELSARLQPGYTGNQLEFELDTSPIVDELEYAFITKEQWAHLDKVYEASIKPTKEDRGTNTMAFYFLYQDLYILKNRLQDLMNMHGNLVEEYQKMIMAFFVDTGLSLDELIKRYKKLLAEKENKSSLSVA